MQKNKGFTLIELLVVIAIIGILSSVVLASLNSARTKAADASVRSNMQAIRAQAEIYYDDNNDRYQAGTTAVATCTGMFLDPVVANARAQALASSANTGATGQACTLSANGQNWAYSITLLKGANVSYCVDNSGASKDSSVASAGGICS